MAKTTYKDAGVDLEKYADAMQRLPRLMHRTFSPRVMKLDGGFAGLFRLDFQGSLFARRYIDPVLVSCTDGVGTKLKVAAMADRHDTVGIDLVAMCVNDAICCGAEPLFFLDYVAMPQDHPVLLEQIVAGISQGCLQADCALLGGETAIMPDLYRDGDYDLAGFCVGVVERARLIDGSAIRPGDAILGLASSGLHSNGFSLVRKLVFEIGQYQIGDHIAELDQTVAESLLTPTRIYVPVVRSLLQQYRVKQVVHGIAHITGGGLVENLERIIPSGSAVRIESGSWAIPPIFPWLQSLGDVDDAEMARVFNLGVGLVLVVSNFHVAKIQRFIQQSGINCWQIGEIVTDPPAGKSQNG